MAIDKLNAMNEGWFKDAAESLIIIDDEFHNLVAHPAVDNVTSVAFKKKVIELALAHGWESVIAANNVLPTSPAHVPLNYAKIIVSLKGIQSQLSDTCAETFETMFVIEHQASHPLKAMRIWQRMSESIHKVMLKDRGEYMVDVQEHARCIPSWELDDLTAWIHRMEDAHQDLIKSGHTSAVTDDCIVINLLESLVSIP